MSLVQNTGKLAGCTLFITGASRGIGKYIALKAAQDGANIVIAAKTAHPHPKLPGTIYTAAKEIEAAGGSCLSCVVDVREEEQVQAAVDEAVKKFGGIDILVNNASAITLTGTLETSMKKYDLMMDINSRGTFLTSKLCIPHLKKSKNNPHILNIAPPLDMDAFWFSRHCAYSIAKYGMSLCVLGMAEELKSAGIAVNALWTQTAIYTAALGMLLGDDKLVFSRKPEIMADAAYVILTKPSREFTGHFLMDEGLLREEGIKDFDPYIHNPGAELMPDVFEDEGMEFARQVFKSNSSTPPNTPAGVFEKIKPILSEKIVKYIGGSYLFALSGENAGFWLLDLKTGSGSVTEVSENTEADVIIKMDSKSMVDMFQGKLDNKTAYVTGKMKIIGSFGLILKLERLMGQLKSKL